MSHNTIKSSRSFVCYSFALALAGCGKAASDLGMGQQTTKQQEIAPAKSAQVAKKSGSSKKVTRLASIPMPYLSFPTLLMWLAHVAPVNSSVRMSSVALPISPYEDFTYQTIKNFASRKRSLFINPPPSMPIRARSAVQPIAPCARLSANGPIKRNCRKNCNDWLDRALEKVDEIQRLRPIPTKPIIRYYVRNGPDTIASSEEEDDHAYPQFELKQKDENGREAFFGWEEKGPDGECIFKSPPDEFNKILQRSGDNLTEVTAAFRKTGMVIVSNPTQLREWCNNPELDRQYVAITLAQSSYDYFTMAAERAVVGNVENFIKEQEDSALEKQRLAIKVGELEFQNNNLNQELAELRYNISNQQKLITNFNKKFEKCKTSPMHTAAIATAANATQQLEKLAKNATNTAVADQQRNEKLVQRTKYRHHNAAHRRRGAS